MKDILIVAHFTQAPGELENSRFHYIAEQLSKEFVSVEMVTSTFSHKQKRQRSISGDFINGLSYKFTMLHEPSYSKNVSIKRLFSHYKFGKNLAKYLRTRKKPDVIYCAVPSLDAAGVVTKYAKTNSIRLIIDIQDIWPEAFRMAFDIPLLSKMVFYKIKRDADSIYSSADDIISVSKTYTNRALTVNKKCEIGYSIYLGTDLAVFDEMRRRKKLFVKPESKIWIAYTGTLGHSYDLPCVIDALKIIEDRGVNNYRFIIMGDGPLRSQFKDYANVKGVNVEFTGQLDYSVMVATLCSCDLAVNPISKGAVQSITSKHGDYTAAGLPILNTQENIEFRDLVDDYKIGLNCINGCPEDLADKLLILFRDSSLREELGCNSRRAAEELFDRRNTYKKITSLIKG